MGYTPYKLNNADLMSCDDCGKIVSNLQVTDGRHQCKVGDLIGVSMDEMLNFDYDDYGAEPLISEEFALKKYAMPRKGVTLGSFKYDHPVVKCECGAAKVYNAKNFAPGHAQYCPVKKV